MISGAASGIGAATAKAFAGAGADLVLGWYPGDPHDVNLVRDAVTATGRKALVCELDVASTASVDGFAGAAMEAFGRIDIVVANAGIASTTIRDAVRRSVPGLTSVSSRVPRRTAPSGRK